MPEIVINAREAAIGPGMKVNRILPFRKRRMVGPFIFMDHAGPVSLGTEKGKDMDVLPHPHIGLSTVSYLFKGKVTHRDSLGVKQIIEPGEVNWMTAGKGIAHSERFEDPAVLAGGQLEMIQTWVALPEKDEESDPTFLNYQKDRLPVFEEKGIWMRQIAGEAYGLKSNVPTHSPLFYLHVELKKGYRLDVPLGYEERGLYVAKGTLALGSQQYTKGQLLVFSKEEQANIFAQEDCTLMLLGGDPVGERFIWWNFVSSRKERIEQAREDWKQGRIDLPPDDKDTFIPLPDDKFRRKDPPPEALS
ncbi:pirin family protein [Cyclobacterium plantarum]|uniref:Pirin family protein n=1 Tax=Cyclobacterium plantarum TaxID=2716263 RepID=A0ABX0HAV5_9BACT|nr:pirin family protein [Cyclobacterium plantarum]NHE58824.1 pirin family protein [Cyclobacterium plantarum]